MDDLRRLYGDDTLCGTAWGDSPLDRARRGLFSERYCSDCGDTACRCQVAADVQPLEPAPVEMGAEV